MSTRPGVIVEQRFRPSPIATVQPALVPAVVAPCFQIIDTLDSAGALNSAALAGVGPYRQASLLIDQPNMPDPRDNIAEINVDPTSVTSRLSFGGRNTSLPRGSHGSFGSAFLKSLNLATSAAVFFSVAGTISFDPTVGNVFTFALDAVNPLDISRDVTVTFLGNMTPTQIVSAINTAAGLTLASVFTDTEDVLGGGAGIQYVLLRSLKRGALSSLTIRPGTSALPLIFGAGFDDSQEYRVVGSGFRGFDDGSGSLVVDWVEFFRGLYSEGGVEEVTWPTTADNVWPALVDGDGGFIRTRRGSVSYSGGSATVPLRAATTTVPGDVFFADGLALGEVIKVEEFRFRLGTVDLENSVTDEDGTITSRTYIPVNVTTILARSPMTPVWAYFRAGGLSISDLAGTAASITGSQTPLAARPAIIQSGTISFPANLSSLTLDFQVTEDGAEDEEVSFVFAGPAFANIGELIAYLSAQPEFSQFVVTAVGDRVQFTTAKTGSNQEVIIFATGTVNPALGFSAVAATSDSGKDFEFATRATAESDPFTVPMAELTSVNLELVVSDTKGEHVLTAAAVNIAGATLGAVINNIAEAFGGTATTDLVLYDGPGGAGVKGIPVATISASDIAADSGTISITSIEGGASVSLEIVAQDLTDGFRFLGFADATGGQGAEILAAGAYAGALTAADPIVVTYDDGVDSGAISGTASAGMGAAATADELVALLNLDPDLNGVTAIGKRAVQWFATDAGVIGIRTLLGGAGVSLGVGIAQVGFTNMAFDTAVAINVIGSAGGGNADVSGTDLLAGTTLSFALDQNPYTYQATFATNSAQDAALLVNELVGGSEDVATINAANGVFTLTSLALGAASSVLVTAGGSQAVLGLSTSLVEGSGRPLPDMYVDGLGSVRIGPNILRNLVTGVPFSSISVSAPLYIGYKGLRLDVTSLAGTPGLLTFDSIDEMEAAIGPVSAQNPLALGMFLAMSAAPAVQVSGVGVDEVSAASPSGTVGAWARALELLESQEVYTIAPMTSDEFVLSMVRSHVLAISAPEERGERVAFVWTANPSRAATFTAASGEGGESGVSVNLFTTDVNPGSGLIEAGIDISGAIPVSDGVYAELVLVVDGALEVRRYSVSAVSGNVLSLRTTFTGTENTDGFYTTAQLVESAENVIWAVKVRGDSLTIPGTTRLDRNAVATAMAGQAGSLKSRRINYLAFHAVDIALDGVVQRFPGYYVSAIFAGMVAALPPQQPFTNLPVPLIERVYGTDDTFTEKQMDLIAEGGRWVLVNQRGAGVTTRHQRTTDSTTVESREFSITKALDDYSKSFRSTFQRVIGSNNITPVFLDSLGMTAKGFDDFKLNQGVIASGGITQILQSEIDPDIVLAEAVVQPQYPCNQIRLTIFV